MSVEYLEQIGCLDHGYVRWIDHMGTDLSVVNAARVSFMKESGLWDHKDARLLKWLWNEREYSPFRHATMTFEVYAPMVVRNQWWKYIVGSDHDPMMAWNESSRRYVTEDPIYYTPRFRSAPDSKKQGSGDVVPADIQEYWQYKLRQHQEVSIGYYNAAITEGIAPEQARVFLLGYGLYVRWRWTCSLQGCLWFLRQRMEEKAQSEIREYAGAVYDLTCQRFPETLKAFGAEVIPPYGVKYPV